MVAIAATSRRRYPKESGKRDGDAFADFIAEETIVITGGMIKNLHIRVPGEDVRKIPGAERASDDSDHYTLPLGRLLYVFVRCQLTHEGTLPDNVIFEPDDGTGSLSIKVTDDALTLSENYMNGLARCVLFAPENADDFPQYADLPDEQVADMLFGSSTKNPEYIAARRERVEQLRA